MFRGIEEFGVFVGFDTPPLELNLLIVFRGIERFVVYVGFDTPSPQRKFVKIVAGLKGLKCL